MSHKWEFTDILWSAELNRYADITISKVVLIGESAAVGVDRCKRSAIGIDKPPNLRVIIPTSKIIQPCLGIVIVSAIANGVNPSQPD